MKRRDFLKLSGFSAISATGFSRKIIAETEDTTEYILTIECQGGWDQTLVFDNKLGSNILKVDPSASLGTGAGGINYVHNSSRPNVKTFFDTYGDNSTIVNGILTHDLDAHLAQRSTNSVKSVTLNENLNYSTFYASAAAPLKPYPHVSIDLPNDSASYEVYSYHGSLEAIESIQTSSNYLSGFSAATKNALKAYLSNAYLSFSSGRINGTYTGRKINSLASKGMKENSWISVLTANFDNTQASNLTKRAILALNLFNSNYTQTANILDDTPHSWDDHTNTLSAQNTRFDNLFRDLKIIIDYAVTLGIADRLTILVKSETGRDSRVSLNEKDHWPYTSCLIWSKSITGSKVVGKTDEYLRGIKLDPVSGLENTASEIEVSFDSIYAALFQNFGVNKNLLWKEDLSPSYFILF